MGMGIENRGSQVHHSRRDDLLAKEAEKEIIYVCANYIEDNLVPAQDISKLSQKQRSQLRSYGN
jgi:hypothetical protein